jgi:hypothetical protein
MEGPSNRVLKDAAPEAWNLPSVDDVDSMRKDVVEADQSIRQLCLFSVATCVMDMKGCF